MCTLQTGDEKDEGKSDSSSSSDWIGDGIGGRMDSLMKSQSGSRLGSAKNFAAQRNDVWLGIDVVTERVEQGLLVQL